MRNLTKVTVLAGAFVLSAAMPAQAYPTGTAAIVAVNDPTPDSGAIISATAFNFCPNTQISFTLDGSPVGSTVSSAEGAAVSPSFSAPATGGTFAVVATGTNCDSPSTGIADSATTNITLTGGDLPRTGFDSAGSALLAAALVGAGGLAVATRGARRRASMSS